MDSHVEVTDDLITAHLADGRTISVPRVVVAFVRGDPAQRQHFEIIGTGQGASIGPTLMSISAIGTSTVAGTSPQHKV